MANKRMFSVDVVETDAFLDLPPKVQALYFHLGMRADDDGFVSSPRTIMRTIGCNAHDLKQLEDAGYVISFDSGVLVVTDWKVNNFLRKDRRTGTIHQNELEKLTELSNGRYILSVSGQPVVNQMTTSGQPTVNHRSTQYSIEENRVVEQQRPTAPPAAYAPLKGARGGMATLDNSLDNGDRDVCGRFLFVLTSRKGRRTCKWAATGRTRAFL